MEASDTQTTRLKELLSPSLQPRPPGTPKARERPSPIPPATAPADTTTRECSIPVKRRDAHLAAQPARGKTDSHASPQKHRTHKEPTSEKTREAARTPSLRRSGSSSDHKSPSGKTQSATHAPPATASRTHRDQGREQRRARSEAARVIQRAWRRSVQ